MSVSNYIRSFLLYDGLSKEEYLSIVDDINERNNKILTFCNLLASIVMLFLYIGSHFIDSISTLSDTYLIIFIVTLLMTFIFGKIVPSGRVYGAIFNYIFNTLLLSFGIYIGTIKAPEEPATVFIVLISILPLITHETILSSLIYRLFMCLVFCVIASFYKDRELIIVDLINTICFLLFTSALMGFAQQVQARAYYLKHNLQKEVLIKTKEIEERTKTVERISLEAMTAMAAAIDAKDKYTNGHSERVAIYSRMIAEKLGKTAEELQTIYFIALLHDVGKIGIPDQIINKPSKLSDEEYAIIKTHPSIGYNILKEIEDLPDIAIGARFHHERYDGKGYPLGLSGEGIPEIARIIAVADSYDAMTSNRSYRSHMEQAKVYDEIQKGRGTQFDPQFADIMLNIMKMDTKYMLHE